MKKLLVLGISVFTLNAAFADNYNNLPEEIKNKVRTADLSQIELSRQHEDFVNVRFNVVDGQIVIDEISGSKPELEKLISNRLNQLKIVSETCTTQDHLYKFVFEKI